MLLQRIGICKPQKLIKFQRLWITVHAKALCFAKAVETLVPPSHKLNITVCDIFMLSLTVLTTVCGVHAEGH